MVKLEAKRLLHMNRPDAVRVASDDGEYTDLIPVEQLLGFYLQNHPETRSRLMVDGGGFSADVLQPRYCGRRFTSHGGCRCGECDGTCGPNNGCQCPGCAGTYAYRIG